MLVNSSSYSPQTIEDAMDLPAIIESLCAQSILKKIDGQKRTLQLGSIDIVSTVPFLTIRYNSQKA